MPDYKKPPDEGDIKIRLDRMLCSHCNAGTFELGIVSTDDPCVDCGRHMISRCTGCGAVACISCTEKRVMHLREQEGTNLLAPLMETVSSPGVRN